MSCRIPWVGAAFVAFSLGGCGTVGNTVYKTTEEGGKTPYGGVEYDFSLVWRGETNNRHPPHENLIALFALVDLPLSVIGDTITLPYVLTYSAMRQRLSSKTPPLPGSAAEPAQSESSPGNAFASFVGNKCTHPSQWTHGLLWMPVASKPADEPQPKMSTP
ncbi:MAG TPA: YceK/YidQ family lipoprotein [Gemmata sp.]